MESGASSERASCLPYLPSRRFSRSEPGPAWPLFVVALVVLAAVVAAVVKLAG